MATFAQIKEVRLRISDPYIFIDFLEAANAASLPSVPAHQTAYKTVDTGVYYSTETESGAVLADWTKEILQVSDAKISAWIDAGNVDSASCKALAQIISQLGKELGMIRRGGAGAESIEYQSIKDLYDYYKEILASCKEEKNINAGNSTGRYGASASVEIAGGDL